MFINEAKWTSFFCLFVLQGWRPSCFGLFPFSRLGSSPASSISLSTTAFASGLLSLAALGVNLNHFVMIHRWVQKIFMTVRVETVPLLLLWIHEIPQKTIFCFRNFLRCKWRSFPFPGTIIVQVYLCFTRHSWFRWSQPSVGTQYAHVGYPGVELVSWATYISRKKRNLETVQRHSKALKKAQRDAKRTQPEISHEAAELIFRNQAARTDEKSPGAIHVSNHLAMLHGHENVFFCTQCGAVNAGGALRLLKSQCDGSGESRQKARRKLERGLMPNEHVMADAKRAF